MEQEQGVIYGAGIHRLSRDIDAGGTDGGRPCGAISERGGDADDLNFSDVWDGLSPQVLVLVVFTELEVTKMKNKKMDQADSFDLAARFR